MRNGFIIVLALLLSGCLGMPKGVEPVSDFQLNNYLGTWYEVVRLDHSFERGLKNVTADYSLREDGGVRVINRGYSTENQEWKEAEGKAYFVNDNNQGYLKVSFFGPFYGSYIVFDLDKTNYQYAFISGPNNDYLWLLSRTPNVSQEIIDKFVSMSEKRGFDTNQLIFVEHD
ncbi:lipocalin family protein [Vibrio sp. TBV020]|uniref:lipocalin family protein n=1 Tax=Vibrio sp. TBV020 TaxID=3137398 RepID=UPI0038CDB7AE